MNIERYKATTLAVYVVHKSVGNAVDFCIHSLYFLRPVTTLHFI